MPVLLSIGNAFRVKPIERPAKHHTRAGERELSKGSNFALGDGSEAVVSRFTPLRQDAAYRVRLSRCGIPPVSFQVLPCRETAFRHSQFTRNLKRGQKLPKRPSSAALFNLE